MKKGKDEPLATTVKKPEGKKKAEAPLSCFQKIWNTCCVPSGTEGFEQAEAFIDNILTLATEIVSDKQISKKARPYAIVFTTHLLDTTFDLKWTQRDDRLDDKYFQDPNDSEEPILPPQDNVAHKLGYNRDQLVAKFHEPKLETPSLFKIDDELRSRLSLSKYDMMSSKGKRSVKGGMTPSKTARLTNEEKEMLKLQKMETFLKERMKPAWQWTYTHEPESMVDGSDVCAKIDSSRAKVVANDKRRARIEESNRQKRNNSALDRLMQAIGPGNEEQRVALDPKGGYFIEDEAKIPVIKPAVEKMPGGIQNPVKVHVSKE